MQQNNFTSQAKDVSALKEALDSAEREVMAARSDNRALREQLAEMQEAYKSELSRGRDAEKRHKSEMKQQTVCLSVVALLICAATCAIAAPWWTAVAPALFAFSALRRAGL